jgi:redox-sensitive bicupin YhaK (pirin superfamily)
VQRMSAGRGVRHSEFNPSKTAPVHFLQIWIEPARTGIDPGYEQTNIPASAKRGMLRLIASPDGRDGSVTIHQDATLHAALIDGTESVNYELVNGRRAYVHVARGGVYLNGTPLGPGDAAQVIGETHITLDRGENAEVLLFDLP